MSETAGNFDFRELGQAIMYAREKQRINPLCFPFVRFLVGRNTITIDRTAPDRVAPLSAGISRVALHGIDDAVLAPFHNTHMVGFSVTLPVSQRR